MHTDTAQLDRHVRLRIYDDFLKLSEAPRREHLAAALGTPLEEISASLERLAAARSLVLQDNGEILMANPLSAVPTPFQVRIADRSWFANCIWDALGLVAMLGGFGEVVTSCGCCAHAMTVSANRGRLEVPDEGAVAHFALPACRWWDDIVFN